MTRRYLHKNARQLELRVTQGFVALRTYMGSLLLTLSSEIE